MPGTRLAERIARILDGTFVAPVSRLRLACTFGAGLIAMTATAVATPERVASQRGGHPSRFIVRPLQPRWIPPDSTSSRCHSNGSTGTNGHSKCSRS